MNLKTKRLQALHQYDILDTQPEEAFDNLAKLACHICGTSSAQINFIDKNRQWTKANIGWGSAEIPKEMSFCTHTIQSTDSLMVVSDALHDKRFEENPLVKDNPPLRFYAGVTVKSVNDYPLGTICVFDTETKKLSDQQLESLQVLGKEVETHLKLRLGQDRLKKILAQENRLNQKIISSLPINFFMYNSNRKLVRWNEHVQTTTGYSTDEIKQMKPQDYFIGTDRQKVEKKINEVLADTEVIFEADVLKKDGATSPFVFSLSRFEMNGEDYLIGTGQDITDLKETQHKLKKLVDLFGRFVPREFIRYLSSDDLTNIQLGNQTEQRITILFADIHGFSTISELLTTEDNFNFLNAFLKRIGPCIREHNGIIDKYIGDGVMALFPESPEDAVQAAIEMQKTINRYNYKREQNNREPIKFSIGLHYGDVQLGIIGDEDRYQATVISDDVNQTFRIEGLANEYDAPLLISEELFQRLDEGNKLQIRQLGKLQVKGKDKPVTIHEIIDADLRGQGKLKKELKEIFNKAINMYSKGQYADASQLFSQVLKVNPDDVAAQIYLNKATRNITSKKN